MSWCRKKQKLFSPKGLVKISAICSAVSMDLMMIVPSLTNRLKWWYLMAMCFVRGVNFWLFVTVMQLSFSSQTVQRNTGSLVNSPNNPAVSFIRPRNGITSRIALDKALLAFSSTQGNFCLQLASPSNWASSIHYKKPVHDNTDSGLSWFPSFYPPSKSAST